MNAPMDWLAVLDVQRELGAKQSAKNPNAGFIDWRDWCAFLAKAEAARVALTKLVEQVSGPVAAHGCLGPTGLHFASCDRNECVDEARRDGSRIVELIVRPAGVVGNGGAA